MAVTVTALIQNIIISWNCNYIKFKKFRKSGLSGFPGIPEIRTFRISGKSVFPDLREIRKSGFSGFPENPEIRVFRISGKSGNPSFPDFRKIRKSEFSGFSENQEIRVFRISGIPDFRISQDSCYCSYSINCSGNYFRCCNPLQLQHELFPALFMLEHIWIVWLSF